MAVLDPSGDQCSAAPVVRETVRGDFKDPSAVLEFVKRVQPTVVTVEIEHVNVDALDAVVALGVPVHPAPATIRIIQDKYLQKQHLSYTLRYYSYFCEI